MYGLPQAGIIAQELLAKRLKEHSYTQSKITPGLWTHEWHPITFSIIVDDFRVKYIGEEHPQHLLQMMQKYYMCSFEKEGERYCGLTIKWDYVGKKVHLLMTTYVEKALKVLSASSTYCTAGSAASACQNVVWCNIPTSKPTQLLPTPR
jgi:hypothetical protein